jgi:hypothetical protein
LPNRLRWSAPQRTYDLDDRNDRARLYEQVLCEGLADDIRYYIDADQLAELWDELYLPDHVRQAWSKWLAARGRART